MADDVGFLSAFENAGATGGDTAIPDDEAAALAAIPRATSGSESKSATQPDIMQDAGLNGGASSSTLLGSDGVLPVPTPTEAGGDPALSPSTGAPPAPAPVAQPSVGESGEAVALGSSTPSEAPASPPTGPQQPAPEAPAPEAPAPEAPAQPATPADAYDFKFFDNPLEGVSFEELTPELVDYAVSIAQQDATMRRQALSAAFLEEQAAQRRATGGDDRPQPLVPNAVDLAGPYLGIAARGLRRTGANMMSAAFEAAAGAMTTNAQQMVQDAMFGEDEPDAEGGEEGGDDPVDNALAEYFRRWSDRMAEYADQMAEANTEAGVPTGAEAIDKLAGGWDEPLSTLKWLFGAGAKTILASSGEIAALSNTPGAAWQFLSWTQDWAEERAANDGREEADLSDRLTVAPWAALSVFLGRVAFDKLFGGVVDAKSVQGAARAVGVGAAAEGVQEAVQTTGEVIATGAGTEAGIPEGAGKEIAGAAVLGATGGGMVRAGGEAVGATVRQRAGQRENLPTDAPAEDAEPTAPAARPADETPDDAGIAALLDLLPREKLDEDSEGTPERRSQEDRRLRLAGDFMRKHPFMVPDGQQPSSVLEGINWRPKRDLDDTEWQGALDDLVTRRRGADRPTSILYNGLGNEGTLAVRYGGEARTAGGPDGTSASLDQTPRWFQEFATKWMASRPRKPRTAKAPETPAEGGALPEPVQVEGEGPITPEDVAAVADAAAPQADPTPAAGTETPTFEPAETPKPAKAPAKKRKLKNPAKAKAKAGKAEAIAPVEPAPVEPAPVEPAPVEPEPTRPRADAPDLQAELDEPEPAPSYEKITDGWDDERTTSEEKAERFDRDVATSRFVTKPQLLDIAEKSGVSYRGIKQLNRQALVDNINKRLRDKHASEVRMWQDREPVNDAQAQRKALVLEGRRTPAVEPSPAEIEPETASRALRLRNPTAVVDPSRANAATGEATVRRSLMQMADRLNRMAAAAPNEGGSVNERTARVRSAFRQIDERLKKLRRQRKAARGLQLARVQEEMEELSERRRELENMDTSGQDRLASVARVFADMAEAQQPWSTYQSSRSTVARVSPDLATLLDRAAAAGDAQSFATVLENAVGRFDEALEQSGAMDVETLNDPDRMFAEGGIEDISDVGSEFKTDSSIDKTLARYAEAGLIDPAEAESIRGRLQLDNPFSTKAPGQLGENYRAFDAARQERTRAIAERTDLRTAPRRQQLVQAGQRFTEDVQRMDLRPAPRRTSVFEAATVDTPYRGADGRYYSARMMEDNWANLTRQPDGSPLESAPRRVVAARADEMGVSYPKRATRDDIIVRIKDAVYERARLDERTLAEEDRGAPVETPVSPRTTKSRHEQWVEDYLDALVLGDGKDAKSRSELKKEQPDIDRPQVKGSDPTLRDVYWSRGDTDGWPAFRGRSGPLDLRTELMRTRPVMNEAARPAVDAALRRIGDRPVQLVVDPEIGERYGDRSIRGAYVPAEDTIYVAPGANANVLAHEVVHAAIHRDLANPESAVGADMGRMYDYLRDVLDLPFTDLDEFVAEAMTVPALQRMLDGVPYATDVNVEPMSLWEHFVRFVRRALGMPNAPRTNSALHYLLDRFERRPVDTGKVQDALFMRGPTRLPRPSSRWGRELAERATMAYDSGAAALNRILAFSMNTHDMVDRYGPKLFVDPVTGINTLDRLWTAVREKGRTIDRAFRSNHEFFQPIHKFILENNEAGNALVEAIQVARNFNVDPLTRPELQQLPKHDLRKWDKAYDAYANLTPEAQKHFRAVRDKFRAMSDENIRLVTRGVADAFSGDIPSERTIRFAEAISRAGAKEMQDLREAFVQEHKDVPSVEAIADGMVDLAKRSRLNFYVPNMRFGDRKFFMRARGKVDKPMTMRQIQRLLAEHPILNASKVRPRPGKSDLYDVELVAEVYGHAESDQDLREQVAAARPMFDRYVREYGLIGDVLRDRPGEAYREGGVEAFGNDLSVGGFRLLEAMRDRAERGDVPKSALNAFQTTLFQLMPGNSQYSARLPNRNVWGANTDFIRTMSTAMRADAYYKADLQHGYQTRRALKDAKGVVERLEATDTVNNQKAITAGSILRKWEGNMEAMSLAEQPGRFSEAMQGVTSAAYVYYLASPAYWTLNGTHLAMSAAHASGELGAATMTNETGKALMAIARPLAGAAKRQGLGARIVGMRKPYRDDAFNDLQADVVDALSEYVGDQEFDDLLVELEEEGLIGRTQAVDAVSIMTPEQREGPAARVMDAVRFMPHVTELMARGASAAAIYKAAKRKGYPRTKIRDLMIRNAREVQVDYSGLNEPLWVPRAGAARSVAMSLLLFKKFGWAMASLLTRMVGNSVQIASRDPTARERARTNLKALGGVAGMLFVMSGTEGMLAEPLRIALGLAQLLLDDPDDEDEFLDDPDAWINETAYDLGEGLGMGSGAAGVFAQTLTRGLLGTATGTDPASRIGFQQLVMPRLWGATPEDVLTNALASASPVIGMLGDGLQAATMVGEGHPVHVLLGKAAPAKILRDGAQAYGIAAEGMTRDSAGREALDLRALGSNTGRDAFVRLMGLDSSEVGRYKEYLRTVNGRKYRDSARRDKLLKRLNTAFDKSVRYNDRSYMASALNAIHTYNLLHPEAPIDVRRSLRNNVQRDRSQAVGLPGVAPKEARRFGGPNALQRLQR